LKGEANISDVIVDLSAEVGVSGKLFVGFSSPRKEDINEIELKHELKWQLAAMRQLLSAKNQLFENYGLDYLLLDTSPGIRYWSINTLAAADRLFLIMKINDMDIEGTKNMIRDIYDSLTRFGSKYYFILNKVPGAFPISESQWGTSEKSLTADLEKDLGAEVVASIPCFCDVQFNRHEFLSAVKQPDHPFSKKLVQLAEAIEKS
jgi:cellulose biosynthesis protein BcsQ